MVRRQLYLTRELDQKLRKLSKNANLSESEILREALGSYLAQEDRKRIPLEENPLYQMIGFCKPGGGKDGAANHDEYIYDIGREREE
ncbi:MAG: ribbon-helix-helix domain-containing protein [Firmicutes bacterium]|nr:ribbon-helix-helix domain-containing protein [Bacillota bacterium]